MDETRINEILSKIINATGQTPLPSDLEVQALDAVHALRNKYEIAQEEIEILQGIVRRMGIVRRQGEPNLG